MSRKVSSEGMARNRHALYRGRGAEVSDVDAALKKGDSSSRERYSVKVGVLCDGDVPGALVAQTREAGC